MVAISLNIQQRVHPVIWSVTNLPYDALQAVPINKPIGGCLILCVNSLIYLNQSVPSYGVSLNSTAEHSTNFPLKPQDGVKISLDAAQIAFINNEKLVLSLKDGELYVLSLLADSMRSVRSFHFSRAASSVLTSCVSLSRESHHLYNFSFRFILSDLLVSRRLLISWLASRKFTSASFQGERRQHGDHDRRR
jgi:cleavage and polyadenylation specificity factor subunit 1